MLAILGKKGQPKAAKGLSEPLAFGPPRAAFIPQISEFRARENEVNPPIRITFDKNSFGLYWPLLSDPLQAWSIG